MKFIKNNNENRQEVENRLSECDFSVVCLSNQPWDFELWTNKKQIMSRIRDMGKAVLFVDPPLRVSILDKVIKKRMTLSHLYSAVLESKRLSVYSPFRLTLAKSVSSFNKILEYFI